MARIRHIAIGTRDPEGTARFYMEGLGLKQVGKVNTPTSEGYYLSDGHVNLAILKFKYDDPATTEGAPTTGTDAAPTTGAGGAPATDTSAAPTTGAAPGNAAAGEIEIPADSTVFVDGEAATITLTDLEESLTVAQPLELTLTFENAGEVTLTVTVANPDEALERGEAFDFHREEGTEEHIEGEQREGGE